MFLRLRRIKRKKKIKGIVTNMKKSLENSYLIILLVIYNLILVDVTVFGLSLKLMLLLFTTLIAIFLHTIKQHNKKIELNMSHMDIVICAAGICGLVVFVYKLITDPLNYESAMLVLTLCLVYYMMRIRKESISKDVIFLFSISNAVISVMLLWHYAVMPDTPLPIELLLENNAILSWLILVITVNVAGYCIYEEKRIWYGANAVVGFFLLFLQKNIIATGIMGVLFLFLPLAYMPTKRLIKSAMQMFFMYAFLLCNMSLITGYTELIKVEVAYDLEISVYMELFLAVFGVFFFHYWDKYTTEEDDDRKLLLELRPFFQKTLILVGIITAVFVAAMVRGNTAIMPEIFGKIIEQGKAALANQTGIFEIVALRYGGLGIVFVLYVYYAIIYCLQMKKKPKVSRHQKLFRVVTAMFVIQSLFLTQTMVTLPIYMIFIVTFMKDTNIFEKNVKGENTNEIDYSDSML